MDLNLIRKELDMYDNIIKNMITLRMSLIPIVAQIKLENNLPLVQSKRENEIYHRIETFAEENGVDKELLKNIYHLMISNAIKIEENIVNEPSHSILNQNINLSQFKNIKECFQKLDQILSDDIPKVLSNIIQSNELNSLSLTEKASLYYQQKLENE